MIKYTVSAAILLAAVVSSGAYASPFTNVAPNSGTDVTSVGASTVGGVVVSLVGLNNAEVVSQLSASSLYVGFAGANPLTIGSQAGFDASVTSALGGGLKSVAFRFTLYDGDTAVGNFDQNDNDLLVNGVNFGDWTAVNAENTDSLGVSGASGFSGGGFRNNILDTGWFASNDAGLLTSLFTSLVSAETLTFQIDDVDPFDNFYDFTQGIDKSLINVGQGPVVTPPKGVPAPNALVLMALALPAFRLLKRK